jgi:hypothetical protein
MHISVMAYVTVEGLRVNFINYKATYFEAIINFRMPTLTGPVRSIYNAF